MTITRTLLSLSLFLTILLCFAPMGHAMTAVAPAGCKQGEFCALADVQGSRLEDIYKGTGTQTLSSFFNGLFRAAISFGAILAVLRLGWAGYLYMTSESWGSKGKAREVIGDVVLGLLLLLGCWLILYQINPDILKLEILDTVSGAFITNPPPVTDPNAFAQ